MDRFLKNEIVKKLILKIDEKRVNYVIKTIEPYLDTSGKLIDIGSGLCVISKRLRNLGYDILSLDIRNISLFEDVIPIVYKGEKIPFRDNSFDTALLITVLHHTKDPKSLLKEAKRVAKRIIVMEDTYSSSFQKYLTFIMDSLVNFEFFNHSHTNKTDKDWRKLFKKLDLKIRSFSSCNYSQFLTSTTYFLEKA